MISKINKIITVFTVLSVVCFASVFAISPTGEVSSIGQDSAVGDHIYPVSIAVNYGVYDFPLIQDKPLRFTVALEGGYTTHSINQKDTNGENGWDHGVSTYGVIFSDYSFKLSQAFPIPFDIPGSLDTYYSFDCRYERPITTASFFSELGDGDGETAFTTDGKLKDVFKKSEGLVGTPDLNGNMYLKSFSLKTGISYSNSIDGYNYSISNGAIFAPQIGVFNAGGDKYGGETNYYKLSSSFSINKSLLSMNYDALLVGSNSRLFNLVLSDSLDYRYLKGDKVPIFAQSFGNYRHGVSNTLKLQIDGPQFITADTYPYAYIAYGDDFRWGELNNCTTTGYTNPREDVFSHYYEVHFDIRVIGIIHFSTNWKWTLEKNSLIKGSLEYSPFSFTVNL